MDFEAKVKMLDKMSAAEIKAIQSKIGLKKAEQDGRVGPTTRTGYRTFLMDRVERKAEAARKAKADAAERQARAIEAQAKAKVAEAEAKKTAAETAAKISENNAKAAEQSFGSQAGKTMVALGVPVAGFAGGKLIGYYAGKALTGDVKVRSDRLVELARDTQKYLKRGPGAYDNLVGAVKAYRWQQVGAVAKGGLKAAAIAGIAGATFWEAQQLRKSAEGAKEGSTSRDVFNASATALNFLGSGIIAGSGLGIATNRQGIDAKALATLETAKSKVKSIKIQQAAANEAARKRAAAAAKGALTKARKKAASDIAAKAAKTAGATPATGGLVKAGAKMVGKQIVRKALPVLYGVAAVSAFTSKRAEAKERGEGEAYSTFAGATNAVDEFVFGGEGKKFAARLQTGYRAFVKAQKKDATQRLAVSRSKAKEVVRDNRVEGHFRNTKSGQVYVPARVMTSKEVGRRK